MSSIVSVSPKPGDLCCICQEGFGWKDGWGFTHEGARHDPFHEGCLIQWMRRSDDCPFKDDVFRRDAESTLVRPVSYRELLYHTGSSAVISLAAAVAGAVAARMGNGHVQVVAASSVFTGGVLAVVDGIEGVIEGEGVLETAMTLVGAALTAGGLVGGILLMGEIGVGAAVGTTVAKILGVLDDQRDRWSAMGGVLIGGLYATIALSFPTFSPSFASIAAVSGAAGALSSLLNKVRRR